MYFYIFVCEEFLYKNVYVKKAIYNLLINLKCCLKFYI